MSDETVIETVAIEIKRLQPSSTLRGQALFPHKLLMRIASLSLVFGQVYI